MNLTITVRNARDDDYPAVAALLDSRFGSGYRTAPDKLLAADRRSLENDRHFRRVVAVQEGRVTGTGYVLSDWAGTVQPGRYWVDFIVDERSYGQRLDSTMLGRVIADLDESASELACCIREDHVPNSSFLSDSGFQECFRSWGAQLDLRDFDTTRFEVVIEDLERSGMRFVPFDELQEGDRADRLVALKREIDRDVLSFEPIVPADSVDILSEEYIREGLIVAVAKDGEYIGLTSLRRASTDGDIGCGLTGVRREYRRQGVTTALKTRSLSVAKALGATVIGTGGGGGADSPMRKANEKLGFRAEPAWVTLILTL